MVLPGGRYSCAQVLVQRRLPFLVGRSLGQVCHIVQLAISQKKLLGYLNGTVVPYSRSQSMVKEQSAECQRPCSGAARHKSAVASWDLMRQCLQQLMDNMGPGEHSLPLSNIKRLFRAQFHIELSETALGYAKLSECLQDSRLHDLCEVKLKGHGYGIVPIKKPGSGTRARISLSDSLGMEPKAPPPPPTHIADVSAEHDHSQQCVQRLCMDDMLSPGSTPKAAAQMMAASPMPSKASAVRSCLATPTRIAFPPTPSPIHPSSIPGEVAGAACPLMKSSGTRRVLSMATLAASPMPTPSPNARHAPTPSPSAQYGRALPRLLGRARQPTFVGGAIKEVYVAPPSPATKTTGGVAILGSPARGVTVSDVNMSMQTPQKKAGTPESKPWGFTPMTPRTFGFSVHNTFLHAAMPLPTPVRAGARFRARSSEAF